MDYTWKVLLASLVVVALSAAVPLSADIIGSEGGIVVANRANGSISIIDVATSGVTDVALPAGDNTPEPMYVVFSPDNSTVFVGDRANDRVVVFDATTFDVNTTIPTGAGVFHMWGEPGTGHLWVNNDIDKTVTDIDMISFGVVNTFSTPVDLNDMGGKPHDVILDPSGPYAYVSMLGLTGENDYVLKYDTNTYAELDRQAVGKDPHLSLSAAHTKLYVPTQGGDEVTILDRATLDPLMPIAVPNAHGAVTSADGSIFYTTNIAGGGTDAVYAIDTATDTILDIIDTPFGVPHNLALSPAGDLLYVTHSGGTSDQVSIIDVSTPNDMDYLTSVTVGFNPFGIGTVIPEPSTLLLCAAIAVPLLRRRS
ncbi:MAG: beta-propeller fold lactonase family protein [Phycisphaerae bacterium]